jgi:hypothetical protein
MKNVIIYTLLFAILLQTVGCMSFYPLEKNESINDYLKPDNCLGFALKNGDFIKASSDDCFFFDKPGNYIVGAGTVIDRRSHDEKVFRGEVKMESVDSVKNIVLDSRKYVCYWQKDSTEILFEEENVLTITSKTTPDFWIINDCPPRIISTKDINEIQIEKINTTESIIFGVSYTTFFFLFALGAQSLSGLRGL